MPILLKIRGHEFGLHKIQCKEIEGGKISVQAEVLRGSKTSVHSHVKTQGSPEATVNYPKNFRHRWRGGYVSFTVSLYFVPNLLSKPWTKDLV